MALESPADNAARSLSSPWGHPDAIALAEVVASATDAATYTDLGCGNGYVAIHLARERRGARILGIDVDASKCAEARGNAHVFGVADRVTILEGNGLTSVCGESTVMCCNPPLIPGELGWTFSGEGGWETPFWARLICHCRGLRVREIFLHIFDCHGVEERSGRWPSVVEVAEANTYSVESVYRATRVVSAESMIRRNIHQLRDHFPRGKIIIDGTCLPLSEIPPYTELVTMPVHIAHGIFRLTLED